MFSFNGFKKLYETGNPHDSTWDYTESRGELPIKTAQILYS